MTTRRHPIRRISEDVDPSERARGPELVLVWVAVILCSCAAWYAVFKVGEFIVREAAR